jgi:hypothetical protein
MRTKPVHPKKALSAMLVTESGMSMRTKPVHPKKTPFPMLVTDDDIVTCFNELQS